MSTRVITGMTCGMHIDLFIGHLQPLERLFIQAGTGNRHIEHFADRGTLRPSIVFMAAEHIVGSDPSLPIA